MRVKFCYFSKLVLHFVLGIYMISSQFENKNCSIMIDIDAAICFVWMIYYLLASFYYFLYLESFLRLSLSVATPNSEFAELFQFIDNQSQKFVPFYKRLVWTDEIFKSLTKIRKRSPLRAFYRLKSSFLAIAVVSSGLIFFIDKYDEYL